MQYTRFNQAHFEQPIGGIFKLLGLRWLIFVCILLSLSNLAKASNPTNAIILPGEFEVADILQRITYLKDTDGQFTFEQVLGKDLTGQFTQASDTPYEPGITRDHYWIKISIRGDDQVYSQDRHFDPWYLAFGNTLVDNVTLYGPIDPNQSLEEKLHTQVRVSGDGVDFHANRAVDFRHPNFLVTPSTEEQIFYGHLSTDSSSIGISLKVWSKDGLAKHMTEAHILRGLFYGMMISIMLYNLFLYFSFRDIAYVYYVGFVTSFVLYRSYLDGILFQYVWPESPFMQDFVATLILPSPMISLILFSREFLQTKINTPILDVPLRALLAVSLVFFFFGQFIPFSLLGNSLLIIGAIIPPLLFSCAVKNWLQGDKKGRAFCIAQACMIIAIFLHILSQAGAIGNYFIVIYSLQIGALIEAYLFAFALSDRINIMRAQQQALEEQAISSLQESSRLKDEFLATISHELRTPMNGVGGSLDLLKTTGLSNEQTKYVNTASQSASQMMELVSELLEFSEGIADKVQLDLQTVDLHQLLRELSKEYSDRCETKHLEFVFAMEKQTPQFIKADRDRLYQLIEHLLDNAFKFTNSGKVRLSAKMVAQEKASNAVQIEFQVIDTGIGIKPEVEERIFEIFSQGDSSFSRQFGGLGIGLAICKKLVENMNGEISLHSTPDEGSTFIVSLPFTLAENPTAHKEEEARAVSLDRSGIKILVVEDNKVNQTVLCGILRKLGFQTAMANNGQECLDILSEQSFDLILMDCQMPILDGFETTKQIRKGTSQAKNIPIVAVTANVMSHDKELCFESGMDDFLQKPVKKAQIEATISHWLVKSTQEEKIA